MRTVTFQSVLYGVTSVLGYVPKRDLTTERAAALTEYINRSVDKAWRFDFWPEWLTCEQRGFRLPYDNAKAYPAPTAAAPVEVFDPATVSYYQASRATTGNPPTVLSNGSFQVNGAFWALSAQGYSQPTWFVNGWYWGVGPSPGFTVPDWSPNTNYTTGAVGTIGSQVRNPGDNRLYQCIATHTSGGAFDATKFGLLTPFNKYIAYDQGGGLTPMDEVKRVCDRDPYVYPKTPGERPFRVSGNGVQVKWDAPSLVYVEYRQRPPVFTSVTWSATAAYVAGNTVYYGADCWVALVGSTNVSPGSDGTKWELIAFPKILAETVKRGALALAYRDQKQSDRADDEEERAREEIEDEWDRVLASQGQFETARAEVYGS